MGHKCLVIGDLNIDLIFEKLDRFPELGSEILARESYLDIGGSGGIFSAVLSQLGVETFLISEIGNDYFGRFLIEKLEKYGVKTNLINVNENKNTGITVTASYPKDKYQISELDILSTMDFAKLKKDFISELNHIHFTSYYMMKNLRPKYINFIKEVKKVNKSIKFSMDTNDDPYNEWNSNIATILKNIDILFLNEKEALKISDSATIEKAVETLKYLAKVLVIKLGPKGGMVNFSENIINGRPIDVDFQDSTGAGDNFDAGFVFGYLKDLEMNTNLRIANICGGNSVDSIGGVGKIERFVKLR